VGRGLPLQVMQINRDADGRPSEAERCGRVHIGDTIVAVDGVSVLDATDRRVVLGAIMRKRPVTVQFACAEPIYYRVLESAAVLQQASLEAPGVFDRVKPPNATIAVLHCVTPPGAEVTFAKLGACRGPSRPLRPLRACPPPLARRAALLSCGQLTCPPHAHACTPTDE